MRTRTKWNFSQLGILCLVLVMAMGTVGISYAAWTDTVTISGTVNTGNVDTELSCGTCWWEPDDGETGISCDVANNVLEITVTNAQLDVNYYCDFKIKNIGTIPVKIQSIVVSGLPEGVVADITGVAEGTVIDPGETHLGTVNINLDNAIPGSFDFTVTFTIVRWNE